MLLTGKATISCALVLALIADVIANQPVVDVPNFGTIYGETIPFQHDYPQVDKTINVYKGIPFAKNASHYRFMKPDPLMALEGGELNATTYSSICWQLPEMLENDIQSEDCLYLNVWTPNPTVSGPIGEKYTINRITRLGGGGGGAIT